MYAYDLAPAIAEIRRTGAQRVGLETPDGLKRLAPDAARKIEEETGAGVVVSGESCWGACDTNVKLWEQVDLLVHLGHAPMLARERMVFVPVRMEVDPLPVVEKALARIPGRRVVLLSTVQHLHKMGEVEALLRARGKEPLYGPDGGRVKAPGQMLGCDFRAARADGDALLYVGSGDFHPLGAAMGTRKPVVVADPVTGQVRVVTAEGLLEERRRVLKRAAGARRWGILVSPKPGQARGGLARKLAEEAARKGWETQTVFMDEVAPSKVDNFGFDAWVNTACPRLALDDAHRFEKPMLTPQEFEVLLGLRKWEEYVFDEISGHYDIGKGENGKEEP
jgi:2-(3-amino-3-carboxypropyl)histidine synthase